VLRFSDKFQTVWGSECCASQARYNPGGCRDVHVIFSGWPEPYMYGVYTVFWQGNHQVHGHIYGVCICTVLANATHSRELNHLIMT